MVITSSSNANYFFSMRKLLLPQMQISKLWYNWCCGPNFGATMMVSFPFQAWSLCCFHLINYHEIYNVFVSFPNAKANNAFAMHLHTFLQVKPLYSKVFNLFASLTFVISCHLNHLQHKEFNILLLAKM